MNLPKLISALCILYFAVVFWMACREARADEYASPLPYSVAMQGVPKPAEPIPQSRIQPIVDRAAKWLNAKGHHVEPIAPSAYYTRLNGFDGISVDGDIVVNSESIPECFPVIVAHEFVHLALGRSEGATPSQSETLAREIEQDASDDYVPNCKTEP